MKIIIVGAGEVGFHIAGRLATENKEVVVVDSSPRALSRVSDNLDVQVIQGSGCSPVILEEAGIGEAEILLAVTDSDETNLVSCLFADILSPATRKLIRMRDLHYMGYEKTLADNPPHIDKVINPDAELVRTVRRLMAVPGAVDVAEFGEGRLKLIGLRLEKKSPFAGLRLAQIREITGGHRFLIAAIVREDKLIVPRGKDTLAADDIVYVMTEQNTLSHVLNLFNKRAPAIRRALVVGGGRAGYQLAQALEQDSIYTKVIEKDTGRCGQLAENLNKAVVLQGDGSDQELLIEENVGEVDVVITVTGDQETNILASLLARRMGVRMAITRIDRFSYFPIMNAIGMEHVISPRLSAINSILQHVRRGKVLSSVSLKGELADVLEAVALETSDIVGSPLADLSFPKGALVIAIIREKEVIVPSGDSVIQPHDRIIILAAHGAIPKVEKALAVKLEYF